MLIKEYIIAKASEYYTKYDNSYECSTSVPAVISRKEVLLVETSVFDVRGYHTKWYTTREYTQSEIVRPTNKTRAYKASFMRRA